MQKFQRAVVASVCYHYNTSGPIFSLIPGKLMKMSHLTTISALVVKHKNDNLTLHDTIVSQIEYTRCSWDYQTGVLPSSCACAQSSAYC